MHERVCAENKPNAVVWHLKPKHLPQQSNSHHNAKFSQPVNCACHTHTHTHTPEICRSCFLHTHTCTAYLNQAYNYSVGRYTKRPGKNTRLGCIRHTWAREMSTSQRRRSVLPAADRRGKHLQNNHDNTLKNFHNPPWIKEYKTHTG